MTLARSFLALAFATLSTAPALAEDAPACASFAWSVARERSAFTKPDLTQVGSGAALLAGADAAQLALKPETEVTLPVTSDRPAKPGTFAGFVTGKVPVAGTYQITLSDAAWVDVCQDGKTTLKPASHSDKAGCPEVRKSLRFALDAGPVTIEVSNVPTGQIKLSFMRAE